MWRDMWAQAREGWFAWLGPQHIFERRGDYRAFTNAINDGSVIRPFSCNIARKRGRAATINYGAAANNDVVHAGLPGSVTLSWASSCPSKPSHSAEQLEGAIAQAEEAAAPARCWP
jgi:hypothetical protein